MGIFAQAIGGGGVTVNGLLPKNLARKMSSYELGDDFSKSARNIDLDSASVTVTIDGNHPLAGDRLSFERSPPFKPSSPEDSSHFPFAPKNGRLK